MGSEGRLWLDIGARVIQGADTSGGKVKEVKTEERNRTMPCKMVSTGHKDKSLT